MHRPVTTCVQPGLQMPRRFIKLQIRDTDLRETQFNAPAANVVAQTFGIEARIERGLARMLAAIRIHARHFRCRKPPLRLWSNVACRPSLIPTGLDEHSHKRAAFTWT